MRRTPHIPAWKRAANTDKWTEILFRALTARVAKRWRFVSFRGVGGGEWRGIVDVLAIRKNTRASVSEVLRTGDLFEIILVQMKGGGSKAPNVGEKRRLKAIAKHYGATEIVLYAWEKGRRSEFSTLDEELGWIRSSARDIFG